MKSLSKRKQTRFVVNYTGQGICPAQETLAQATDTAIAHSLIKMAQVLRNWAHDSYERHTSGNRPPVTVIEDYMRNNLLEEIIRRRPDTGFDQPSVFSHIERELAKLSDEEWNVHHSEGDTPFVQALSKLHPPNVSLIDARDEAYLAGKTNPNPFSKKRSPGL